MAEREGVIDYVYWYSDYLRRRHCGSSATTRSRCSAIRWTRRRRTRTSGSGPLHPEDAEKAIAATWRSTLDGVPYDITYRMVTRDSRLIWIHDTANVERDDTEMGELWRGTWTVIEEPSD